MTKVRHLYISAEHNFFGHHGRSPGDAPMVELDQIECVAGRGIRNDRFFDFKERYKGQITFFAEEVYEDLCRLLQIWDKPPSVLRRNVITADVDLDAWLDAEFEVLDGSCLRSGSGGGAARARRVARGNPERWRPSPPFAMILAAVLLAGGESRRMGRDKATLVIDGLPLWQRQIAILRQLSPVLFVSARERPAWLPVEARFIGDAQPARGPLGGVAATLGVMPGTHLLALPVDMPAMSAAHLATLWGAALPGSGVLPWLGDHAEPLPAIYPAEAYSVAVGLLEGGDFSLNTFAQALLAAGRMTRHTVAAPDANLYVNLNSPADLQAVTSKLPMMGDEGQRRT
jgi:molybdopterin-guanine dinucleotide biosynthesis protein A